MKKYNKYFLLATGFAITTFGPFIFYDSYEFFPVGLAIMLSAVFLPAFLINGCLRFALSNDFKPIAKKINRLI